MRRRRSRAKTQESPVPLEKPRDTITFEVFFARCLVLGKLKSWQHDEILAFFRDINLRDREAFEVFEDALKKY